MVCILSDWKRYVRISRVYHFIGPPTITVHPASQFTSVDSNITLNCKGIGRLPIEYQWQNRNSDLESWSNISDSNTQIYSVSNLLQSQQFRCVVWNEAGESTSITAIITLLGKYLQVQNIASSIPFKHSSVLYHIIFRYNQVQAFPQGVYIHWTELVDWNTGLDYWTDVFLVFICVVGSLSRQGTCNPSINGRQEQWNK